LRETEPVHQTDLYSARGRVSLYQGDFDNILSQVGQYLSILDGDRNPQVPGWRLVFNHPDHIGVKLGGAG
jgi:hypothetical protein